MEAADQIEATRLREIGNQHFVKGEFKQAEDLYSQALQFDPNDWKIYANRSAARAKLEAWNDALSDALKSTELNSEYTKGWFRQAEAFKALHQWSSAADAYIRCLELEPDMPEAIQGVGFTVVQDLLEKMPYNECKETLSSIEEKFKMVADTAKIDIRETKRFFHEALQICNMNGLQSNYHGILRNLGLCFTAMHCYNDALGCFQALRAFQPKGELESVSQRVHFYCGLAKVYLDLDRIKPAAVYIDRASAIALKCSDPEAISATLHTQGMLFIKEMKYAKAVDALSQAIELRERNGLPDDSHTLKLVAGALRWIGDDAKAIQYEVRAGKIDHDPGDPESRAIYLSDLGRAYMRAQNWSQAEKSFREAIEIDPTLDNMLRQKMNLAMSKHLEADSLRGSEEQRKELLQSATTYYHEALVLAERVGDRTAVVNLQAALGRTLVDNQLYLEAKPVLEAGIKLAKQLQTKDETLMWILFFYAQCLLAEKGQETHAIELLKEARTILNSIWSGLSGDRTMILWRTRGFPSDCNRLLTDAYARIKDIRNALETVEYDRSPALLVQLGKKKGISVAALGYDGIIQEARLRNAVFAFYAFSEASESGAFAWVVTPSSSGVQSLTPPDSSALKTNLLDIPSLPPIDESNQKDVAGRTAELDISESLEEYISEDKLKKYHDDYWKPLSSILQEHKKTPIYIFPEGKLWKIPFAALIDQGSYVIDSHTIILAPSVGVLKTLRENNEAYQHANEHKALVVGNPTMPNIAAMTSFSSLPYAEQEAIEVADLLEVKAYCGAEAKKAVIVDLLKNSAIAHIATHGFLRSPSQAESYLPGGLVLASCGKDKDTEESCLLLAEEIQELSLNGLKLAVLSCCHTGSGDVYAEGLVGLGRAFLFAGCQCVLLSRWSISDSATRTFMKEFYKHFTVDGANAATALRNAMLYMKSKRFSVRDWASFYVLGNGG